MFRRGIMAIQLLATLTIDYHLLKCGIIVDLVNLRHPSLSTPLDVYLVSQPERLFYVSFRKLILSCSIFEEIDPSRVSFFPPPPVMLTGFLRARRQDKDGVQINVHLKCTLDREDYTSCVSPSPYPTLESRDEILV